jgi:hypothetical protein
MKVQLVSEKDREPVPVISHSTVFLIFILMLSQSFKLSLSEKFPHESSIFISFLFLSELNVRTIQPPPCHYMNSSVTCISSLLYNIPNSLGSPGLFSRGSGGQDLRMNLHLSCFKIFICTKSVVGLHIETHTAPQTVFNILWYNIWCIFFQLSNLNFSKNPGGGG